MIGEGDRRRREIVCFPVCLSGISHSTKLVRSKKHSQQYAS